MNQYEKKGYQQVEEKPYVHHFHVRSCRKVFTNTHKESNNNKHGGQVDCDDCLEELILVKISCVANYIEYYGWYEYV